LLEKINEFKHNVKAIHLWGKYGRDAHAGDMNDFFDYNQELKELFFNKIYKIFKDGHDLYFIPEINNDTDCKSKKECLKNIVTDLINAGFKFENTKIAEILEKYDKKAEKKNYYKLYKNAKLENLQTCLICLINNKNGNILELGFGAGREIEFLLKKGYKNIYGIEGSEKFLELVKKELKNENKYKNIADNLYYSVLPEINIPEDIKFDLIFSTFVWNYLPEIFYEKTIKNITNLLKSNGKVIISYSLNNDDNQEIVRYEINEKYLINLFKKYGMNFSEKKEMEGSYNNHKGEEISFEFNTLVFEKS
jgi:SAM-dependent methyltransferase